MPHYHLYLAAAWKHKTNHGNVNIWIRIICILENVQWHTDYPRLCLIRSLLIYAIVLHSCYVLFCFFNFLPQNSGFWPKESVGSCHFLRYTFPTMCPCIPIKRDVENHPLLSTHIPGAWGVHPLPLGLHPHVTLTKSLACKTFPTILREIQ